MKKTYPKSKVTVKVKTATTNLVNNIVIFRLKRGKVIKTEVVILKRELIKEGFINKYEDRT